LAPLDELVDQRVVQGIRRLVGLLLFAGFFLRWLRLDFGWCLFGRRRLR
jgi:hypothetical protein